MDIQDIDFEQQVKNHTPEVIATGPQLYVPDEMMPILAYFKHQYQQSILKTNFMLYPHILFSAQQMILQYDSAILQFIGYLESINATRKAQEAEQLNQDVQKPQQNNF